MAFRLANFFSGFAEHAHDGWMDGTESFSCVHGALHGRGDHKRISSAHREKIESKSTSGFNTFE